MKRDYTEELHEGGLYESNQWRGYTSSTHKRITWTGDSTKGPSPHQGKQQMRVLGSHITSSLQQHRIFPNSCPPSPSWVARARVYTSLVLLIIPKCSKFFSSFGDKHPFRFSNQNQVACSLCWQFVLGDYGQYLKWDPFMWTFKCQIFFTKRN